MAGLRPGVLLTALAAVLAPTAQPAAQEQPETVTLPPVTVTAPAPLPETLPRSSVPSALDVLTRDEVRASTPRVLPDALKWLWRDWKSGGD